MTNKQIYETPSSEAFEFSLEGNILSNLEDTRTKPETDWDDPNS